MASVLRLLLVGAPLVTALSPQISLPGGQGDVVGSCSDSECVWKGIPFGEDTSGANRFVAPVKRSPWSTPLNATADAPGCISIHHNPDTARVQSEDCLNLDVYAPATATSASKLPVYVFLYGGSFTEGCNYGPFDMYSGTGFTRNDVIFVAPNYRLGAFAFLVTDKLTGNVGLLDQRLALQWVQDNIAAFGGDPDRVTLGGESAGAMSVGYHLVSPGSWPYFNAAIMESNPSALLPRPNDRAELYGADFCELLGCLSLFDGCSTECIQKAPAANVSKAWSKAAGNDIIYVLANWGHLLDGMLDFKPTVDGTILPNGSVAAVMADQWARKPLLLGSNTAEGVAFLGSTNVNELEFVAAIELLFAGKPQHLVDEVLLRFVQNAECPFLLTVCLLCRRSPSALMSGCLLYCFCVYVIMFGDLQLWTERGLQRHTGVVRCVYGLLV